MENRALFLF